MPERANDDGLDATWDNRHGARMDGTPRKKTGDAFRTITLRIIKLNNDDDDDRGDDDEETNDNADEALYQRYC
ncbi:unnamed protein product [Gongylonema pulchrum]|uniref:Uncharacterized protein n=1 Tax=Gongylonema pulchrum TaxID=637853 RepID=A0A183EQ18_9BILA|nr:unnamed protein product [Gongylonema pulchrum]